MTYLNLPFVFVPLIGLTFPTFSIIFYVQKSNIL